MSLSELFFAIWSGQLLYGTDPSGIIENLQKFEFPFTVKIRIAKSDFRFLSDTDRNVRIQVVDVRLPPVIVQIQFSPAGMLSGFSGTQSLVLGAHTEDELISLIAACGFELVEEQETRTSSGREAIPEDVQIFVWRRDKGQCVKCGGNENLEYDHIIPISKGGSNTARNIQLLCVTCNRQKGARIGS